MKLHTCSAQARVRVRPLAALWLLSVVTLCASGAQPAADAESSPGAEAPAWEQAPEEIDPGAAHDAPAEVQLEAPDDTAHLAPLEDGGEPASDNRAESSTEESVEGALTASDYDQPWLGAPDPQAIGANAERRCPHCGVVDPNGQDDPSFFGGEGGDSQHGRRLRHVGRGHPLVHESWRYRPYGAAFMLGGLWGGELIDGRVDQDGGLLGDFRLGYDIDYFFGLEARFGIASPSLDYPNRTNAYREADVLLGEISVLYFPWGDAQWRPYARLGLGLADIDFRDEQDQPADNTLFGLPFGGGVKYRLNSRWVLRLDFTDQITFGSGEIETEHNLSVAGGVEWRFGGARMSYWPWEPSPFLW